MQEPTLSHAQNLLQTKLVVPPLRAQHALRPRLVEKMGAEPDARVILVSAPAGYGKSSCLAEWAETMQAHGVKIAWYSLDEQDNDPARFAAYLAEAFRLADPEISDNLHLNPPIDLQAVIAHLLNTIASRTTTCSLVLDDYHVIASPQIHHAMGTLCDFLPANLRLVIGTRADPPLPLARLRARSQLAEIRMNDLCFTRAETSALLLGTLGWLPSTGALEQIDTAAEGWAAALALLAMSLRQEGAADLDQALERQLAGYSRTQRHFFVYFAAEVLDQQPSRIRDFLLDTCVLARLEPHLCTALTDDPHALLTLHELANANLFLLPLAEGEPIYRYHPLFGEFLCQYLTLHDSERLPKQHRRAAEWYIVHGQIADAVTHALEATDLPLAARLIEEKAWPLLTSKGEIETIVRWLPRFSEEDLQHFPRLTLYFSRALYLTGELERSRIYVQWALAALDEAKGTSDEMPALRAVALSYQATLAAYRGEIALGLTLIARAETMQDAASSLDRVRIANTEAFLHFLRGDVTAARQGYDRALELAHQIDHHYLALDAIAYLAQIDLMEGALQKAESRCNAVLAHYPTPIAPLGTIMLPMAYSCYAQNRIDEAETLVRDAIDMAQRGGIPELLWRAHALLALMLAGRGEWESANAEIQRAEHVASRFHSPFMLGYIGAVRARIWLSSGNRERAVAWAAGEIANVEYQHDFEQLTLVRIRLIQGRLRDAQILLERIRADMQESGRLGCMVEARLLEVALHQELNRPGDALQTLAAALPQAAAEGEIRPFVEIGESLHPLLKRAIALGIEPDFAQKVFALTTGEQRRQDAIENLTEREIEVLVEVSLGRSNQEIADILVVSLGTVKSHLNHIMGKLDVRNRMEAVIKARSMNLIDQ